MYSIGSTIRTVSGVSALYWMKTRDDILNEVYDRLFAKGLQSNHHNNVTKALFNYKINFYNIYFMSVLVSQGGSMMWWTYFKYLDSLKNSDWKLSKIHCCLLLWLKSDHLRYFSIPDEKNAKEFFLKKI